MKILFLIQNYDPSIGGSQELVKKIAEGLVRYYSDQVTVITTNAYFGPQNLNNRYIPISHEWINGVEVYRYSYSKVIPWLLSYYLKF